MAGVTDLGFRTVCRELGAGYTVTEMVSAKALCYQDKKSLPLLELGEGEHPAAVQLFGSDPYCMEQAAGIAAEKSGADILDINMGCPVPKVANSGDGSGLMRNPELAVKVAEAVIRGRADGPSPSNSGWAGTRAPSTAWSSPRPWRPPVWPPWRSTAAPRCRCTPAGPTGTISGR